MSRKESSASRTDRHAGIILSITTAIISVMVLVAAYMPIYSIGETKYGSRQISLLSIIQKLYKKLISLEFVRDPAGAGLGKTLEFIVFFAGSAAILFLVVRIIVICLKRAIIMFSDAVSRLVNMEETTTNAYLLIVDVLLLKLLALLGISMYYWMNGWDSIQMINVLTRAEDMSFWWKVVLIISVANGLIASIYYGLVAVLRNINVTAKMVDIVMGNMMYLFSVAGFIYSTFAVFEGVIGKKTYGNIGISYIIPSIQNVVTGIGTDVEKATGNYDIYLMIILIMMFVVSCLFIKNLSNSKKVIIDDEVSTSSIIVVNLITALLSVGAIYLLGMAQKELADVMNGALKPAYGVIVPIGCAIANIFMEIVRKIARR